MTGYALRRVLSTVPVFIFVALFVFFLLRITPGDPAIMIAGDHDGWIAGRDAQQEKHEQRHENKDRHGRKHTAKRVARHGQATIIAPALLLL